MSSSLLLSSFRTLSETSFAQIWSLIIFFINLTQVVVVSDLRHQRLFITGPNYAEVITYFIKTTLITTLLVDLENIDYARTDIKGATSVEKKTFVHEVAVAH